MTAKTRGLGQFVVEFYGSGYVAFFAKDKEDAFRQFAKISNRRLYEAMELTFEEPEEADDRG